MCIYKMLVVTPFCLSTDELHPGLSGILDVTIQSVSRIVELDPIASERTIHGEKIVVFGFLHRKLYDSQYTMSIPLYTGIYTKKMSTDYY